MFVTIGLLFLMALRRVASELHPHTPPMRLMSKIMRELWKGWRIESVC
jgi:hypothetical protein